MLKKALSAVAETRKVLESLGKPRRRRETGGGGGQRGRAPRGRARRWCTCATASGSLRPALGGRATRRTRARRMCTWTSRERAFIFVTRVLFVLLVD